MEERVDVTFHRDFCKSFENIISLVLKLYVWNITARPKLTKVTFTKIAVPISEIKPVHKKAANKRAASIGGLITQQAPTGITDC